MVSSNHKDFHCPHTVSSESFSLGMRTGEFTHSPRAFNPIRPFLFVSSLSGSHSANMNGLLVININKWPTDDIWNIVFKPCNNQQSHNMLICIVWLASLSQGFSAFVSQAQFIAGLPRLLLCVCWGPELWSLQPLLFSFEHRNPTQLLVF